MAAPEDISGRIRDLQELYLKWVDDNPHVKTDLDACARKLESYNNLYLVWLGKSKIHDYEECKDNFKKHMDFITGVYSKIESRDAIKNKKAKLAEKLFGGKFK